MLIIDDLLLLPAKGIWGLFKKITERVEEEMTDEAKVKEELLKLQTLFETDKLSEKEYEKGEKKLMKRLEEIRKYKQKHG